MKQPEVFKKIGAIIQELTEQYEYLQTTAENLNDLELELFVANTHFLKDHAEILRKLNLIKNQTQLTLPEHTEQKPVAEKKAAEPKYFEPVVQQAKPATGRTPFKTETPKAEKANTIQFELSPPDETPVSQIDLSADVPADSYSFEREEPETIRHELIIDEADVVDEEEVQVEKVKEKPAKPAAEETKPVAEEKASAKPTKTSPEENIPLLSMYADEPKAEPAKKDTATKSEEKVLTLNEKMSAQLKDKNVSAEQEEAPITDIKAAISLNDKLLFVKDLFNGYNLAYSEAIEIVNRFSRFEEADRFLKTNYVVKNNWADKKATADKFYALLKRRYA